MNAYTTTPDVAQNISADSNLRRIIRAILVEFQRSLELTGAAYKHGVMPPR